VGIDDLKGADVTLRLFAKSYLIVVSRIGRSDERHHIAQRTHHANDKRAGREHLDVSLSQLTLGHIIMTDGS
jgi:hypothetical protein